MPALPRYIAQGPHKSMRFAKLCKQNSCYEIYGTEKLFSLGEHAIYTDNFSLILLKTQNYDSPDQECK